MTITLHAVNELIASLESAGELSIREQKFLKLAKEFRICSASLDAAIKTGNMLAEKNAQLAAENVALNNFIAKSCYVQAGENASWYPAIDHAPEIPTTNQLSIEESQFLTDVITAAGLLSCGKQDKGLARRITDFCVVKRGSSNPAQLREGDGK